MIKKKIAVGFMTLLFITNSITLPAQQTIAGHNSFYDVKNFGARGDGENYDHFAINKTIQACVDAGGGTVIVPAGLYICGSIRLQSNINLHLQAGAIIKGAPAGLKLFDSAEVFPHTAYQDGGHTYFHNSLIWGENLVNVSITGNGMIDGGGLTKEDKEKEGIVLRDSIGTGDKAIALKLCRNVLIRDITIFHGGHFAIIITGCDLTTIDNVTVDTNRDGIDIDCCTNTNIVNCRVNSPGDDAIVLKSSYALNRKVISEKILISNCIVSGFKEGTLLDGTRMPVKSTWSNGRIKFGTESNGGFRNCVITGCVFKSCNGLALEVVDGGIMENILVSNLLMDSVYYSPIYITLGKRNRGPAETTGLGTVNNIWLSDIIVMNADSFSGIQLTGLPEKSIATISLSNISVTYNGGGTIADSKIKYPELGMRYPEPALIGINPAFGIFARHVDDLQLNNINFYTKREDKRPVAIFENVNGLRVDGFDAPAVKSITPIRLINVQKLNIINAQLFKPVN